MLSSFAFTPNTSCFFFSLKPLCCLSLLYLVSFSIYSIPVMTLSIYLLNFPLSFFSSVTPHSWKNMQTLTDLSSYHFSKQCSASTVLLLAVYLECCYAENIASRAEQYLIVSCLQVSIVSLAWIFNMGIVLYIYSGFVQHKPKGNVLVLY